MASEIRHIRRVAGVFVNNQHDKILIKSLYLKGYTAKRLTDEISEKGWTKRGVNKLFKKLRDTGTLTGGQAVADRAVPALKKTSRTQLMI